MRRRTSRFPALSQGTWRGRDLSLSFASSSPRVHPVGLSAVGMWPGMWPRGRVCIPLSLSGGYGILRQRVNNLQNGQYLLWPSREELNEIIEVNGLAQYPTLSMQSLNNNKITPHWFAVNQLKRAPNNFTEPGMCACMWTYFMYACVRVTVFAFWRVESVCQFICDSVSRLLDLLFASKAQQQSVSPPLIILDSTELYQNPERWWALPKGTQT